MSDTTRPSLHHISAKVYCSHCKKFCGLETSDGKGPFLDDCLAPESLSEVQVCPAKSFLSSNIPPRPFTGDSGGGFTGIDRDGDDGGYHSIAVRAMEDPD